MGSDARATIWVGFGTSDFDHVPKSVLDGFRQYKNCMVTIPGDVKIIIDPVFCSSELIGFGLVFFQTEWNHGSRPIDLDALNQIGEDAYHSARLAFIELGIADPVLRVFIGTDYS